MSQTILPEKTTISKNKISTRNSAVELLRIIAMLFIILSHLCYHGVAGEQSSFVFNTIFAQWGILGNLGVDIFVIITGYFMCEKDFSIKNLGGVFTQVWFYSIFMAAVAVVLFGVSVSVKDLVQVFLPTIFNEYWFFTAYIILMIFSPFINRLLSNLETSLFKKLLACCLVLWMIIPTFTTSSMFGNEVIQFVMLYLLGAYFRKNPENFFAIKKNRVVITVLCFVLLFCSNIVITLLTNNFEILKPLSEYSDYFYSRSSVLIIGIAVSMFTCAVYSKPFTNRFINEVASCVFGVYLIHDHPLIRSTVWNSFCDIPGLYQTALFPIYAILIVLAVFVCCCLIEFIRLKTIAKPMQKLFGCVYDKIASGLSKNKVN